MLSRPPIPGKWRCAESPGPVLNLFSLRGWSLRAVLMVLFLTWKFVKLYSAWTFAMLKVCPLTLLPWNSIFCHLFLIFCCSQKLRSLVMFMLTFFLSLTSAYFLLSHFKEVVRSYTHSSTPVACLPHHESYNVDAHWFKLGIFSGTKVTCCVYCSANSVNYFDFFSILLSS